MDANENITAQSFVNGIIGLHQSGGKVEWSVDTTDAYGGDWIMRFESFNGMGGADDFAQALRASVAHNERFDDPRDQRVVVLACVYNEVSDSYFVEHAGRRIPLSVTSWE